MQDSFSGAAQHIKEAEDPQFGRLWPRNSIEYRPLCLGSGILIFADSTPYHPTPGQLGLEQAASVGAYVVFQTH